MPLHPQAAAILQEYLDTLRNRSPYAYLFPGRRSRTRLNRIQGWRAIKAAYHWAGLTGAPGELGTHTLRKTFARLIYSALGHDLVRTSYAIRADRAGGEIRGGSSDPKAISCEGHRQYIAAFCNAIRGESATVIDGREAGKVLAIVEAIYRRA